jgi:hypothetical protein
VLQLPSSRLKISVDLHIAVPSGKPSARTSLGVLASSAAAATVQRSKYNLLRATPLDVAAELCVNHGEFGVLRCRRAVWCVQVAVHRLLILLGVKHALKLKATAFPDKKV